MAKPPITTSAFKKGVSPDEFLVNERIGGALRTRAVPFDLVANKISAIAAAGYRPNKELRSELFADLNHPADALGRVFGDPTNSYRGVYRKAGAAGGGSWSKIGPLPETDYLPTFPYIDDYNLILEILDAAGNSGLRIELEQVHHPHLYRIDDRLAELKDVPPFRASMPDDNTIVDYVDANGNSGFRVERDEIHHKHVQRIDGRLAVLEAAAAANNAALVTPVIGSRPHFQQHGQSTAAGVIDGTAAVLAGSTTPLSYAFKFVGGIRSRDSGATPTPSAHFASLANLTETVSGAYGETGAYATAIMIAQLLQAEDGINFSTSGMQMLFSNAAEGSQSLAALSPGASPSYWRRMEGEINAGRSRTSSTSRVYQPALLTWIHGEQSYTDNLSRSAYAAGAEAIRVATQALRDGVLYDSRLYPALVGQIASHLYRGKATPTIALAQWDLARSSPAWNMSAPMGFLPYSDAQHPTALGYYWMGSYAGIAIKRWLFDRKAPNWLNPVSVNRQGRHAIITIAGSVGALRIDNVMAPTNTAAPAGLQLVTAAGEPIALDGAEPVGVYGVNGKQLRVSAAAALPANFFFRSGWVGDANVGWTNVRDSQGDTITAAAISKPMHNVLGITELQSAN